MVTPWSLFPHGHCLLRPVVTTMVTVPSWPLPLHACGHHHGHCSPMVGVPSMSLVTTWSPLLSPSPHGPPMITVPSMPPSSLSPSWSFYGYCPHRVCGPLMAVVPLRRGHRARCPRGDGHTSRKAIFSSLTPTMCAVSSRSFGPIICTKSSKSTRPPTAREGDTLSAPATPWSPPQLPEPTHSSS